MADPTLRALTIRQPWAWAIAAGFKKVENRGWLPSYRGLVAIHSGLTVDHSSRGFPDSAAAEALDQIGGRNNCWNPAQHLAGTPGHTLLALGAIIAVGELVDAHPAELWCWSSCSPWGDVRYNGRTARHLVLANVRPLATPIPCRGALGLWTPPDNVAARICRDQEADRG